MSFFCPHFDCETENCLRLDVECVPGRAGCVLRGKVKFAVPVEERLPKPPQREPGDDRRRPPRHKPA